MILILSETTDISTTKVVAWLKFFNIPFLRIDKEFALDIIESIKIKNNRIDIQFRYKAKEYHLSDFCFVWNRRGYINFSFPDLDRINLSDNTAKQSIYDHLSGEFRYIKEFFYKQLANLPHINSPETYNINKLIALEAAIDVGLKIPNTIMSKKIPVVESNSSLITKNIKDVFFHKNNEVVYAQQTNPLDEITNEEFGYSLFQNAIHKEYEVRSFVFNRKCYSLANFSPKLNTKDNYDTRYVEDVKLVAYKLPVEIEAKLFLLLEKLNLESGSADLIFDGEDYVFLEVNPVGQFDYVSGYGNYSIEKDIATYIKNYYEKTESYTRKRTKAVSF